MKLKTALNLPLIALVAFSALAETPKPVVSNSAAAKPSMQEMMAKRFASQGGLVQLDTGKKTLLVAFTDDDVLAALANTLVKIEAIFKVPLSRRKVEVKGSPYATAKALQGEDTPGVILFHSCKDEPSMAVYPESGLACVNVSILKGNGETLFKERVSKEMLRAFALTLGGYGTINGGCVLQPAYNLNQLDAITSHSLGPMRVNGIFIGANKLGLPTRRLLTYAQACRMGIAPQPTNDLQKTIWNKIHAEKTRPPTNPIKIEPPAKK